MKTTAYLTLSAALLGVLPLNGQESIEELERRCAEYERQIQRLETENSRLRGASAPVAKEALAPVKPEARPAKVADTARYHTVAAGETLSKIAHSNRTSTNTLVRLNDLKSAELIRVGQKLKLPSLNETKGAPVVENTVSSKTHTVKSGETFYSIARQHGLSIDALSKANPKVEPRSLQIGQELTIAAVPQKHEATEAVATTPAPAATPAAPVEPGMTQTISNPAPNRPKTTIRRVAVTDIITLGDFATQHSMELDRLKRLNGLSDHQFNEATVLDVGSQLYVSAQPLD